MLLSSLTRQDHPWPEGGRQPAQRVRWRAGRDVSCTPHLVTQSGKGTGWPLEPPACYHGKKHVCSHQCPCLLPFHLLLHDLVFLRKLEIWPFVCSLYHEGNSAIWITLTEVWRISHTHTHTHPCPLLSTVLRHNWPKVSKISLNGFLDMWVAVTFSQYKSWAPNMVNEPWDFAGGNPLTTAAH